jgi:hypothetical protein
VNKISPYAGQAQFRDLERSDLLHAGRLGYRLGATALNFGLQAGSKQGFVLRLLAHDSSVLKVLQNR